MPTPKTPKQCKSFCSVVNYLSLFCPDLQKLLKPIVEKAFKEIKLRLTNPPLLHLPKAEGRFILYSDTSIEGTGSSLWQMQEGKARLLGYTSKTLPEACSRYSVTELQMTGFLVNMNLWKNLLKHREFDAAVDHAAVAQIMKAKTEPATTRIMRLLDRLSAFSFNLYYVKGTDMILADYLSTHRQKDLDPTELIPINFCCMQIYRGLLDEHIGKEVYGIRTRVSAQTAGEKVGEVHGADKPLDPNYKPEHQSKSKLPSVVNTSSPSKDKVKKSPQGIVQTSSTKRSPVKTVRISQVPTVTIPPTPRSTQVVSKQHIGSTTPGGMHAPVNRTTPNVSPPKPIVLRRIFPSSPRGENGEDVGRNLKERTAEKISEIKKGHTKPEKDLRDIQKQIGSIEDTKAKIRDKHRQVLNPCPIEGIDVGLGEDILDPEIKVPKEEDFILPPPLEDLIDRSKATHKFLPKQGDIDRLIAYINKKVLTNTNLCVNLRDLRVAYLTSPPFRDIYLYLLQNRIPMGKTPARRLDNNAINYLILDGLLFKIIDDGDDKLDTVLCIPTSKVHILLDAYHSSILGGYTGITKC